MHPSFAALAERFAALVTRPLPEESPHRAGIMAEMAARTGRTADAAAATAGLAAATDRLAAVTEIPRPRLVRWLFAWLAVTALVLAVYLTGSGGRALFYDGFSPDFIFMQPSAPSLGDPPLVTGKPFVTHPWTSPEALAELQTRQDDPVSYQALIRSRIAQNLGLPANYEEHWRKIDPGNGIWPFLRADAIGSVLAQQRLQRNVAENDPVRFAELLAALREAAACPKWVDYSRQALALQRAAFRQPRTLRENSETLRLLNDASQPDSQGTDNAIASEVINAKSGITTAAPLAEILDAWIAVARLRTEQPGNPLPVPISYQQSILNRDFREAAVTAKLAPQELQLRRLAFILEPSFSGSLPVDRFRSPGDVDVTRWTPGDVFAPRRAAIYAANDIDMAVLLAGTGLLLLLGFFTLGVWGGSDGLAAGLSPLFPARGTVRMIVFGVLLPAAAWWFMVHWTPAGGRDYAINSFYVYGMQRALWLYQWFAGALLVAVCSVTFIRAEIARRTGFLGLGFRRRAERILAGAVILVTASLPLLTWQIGENPSRCEAILQAIAPLLGVPFLWLMWTVVMGLLHASGSAAQRAVAARCGRPVLLAFCILLLAWVPWLRHVQREALSRDPATVAGPEATRLVNLETDARAAFLRTKLQQPVK